MKEGKPEILTAQQMAAPQRQASLETPPPIVYPKPKGFVPPIADWHARPRVQSEVALPSQLLKSSHLSMATEGPHTFSGVRAPKAPPRKVQSLANTDSQAGYVTDGQKPHPQITLRKSQPSKPGELLRNHSTSSLKDAADSVSSSDDEIVSPRRRGTSRIASIISDFENTSPISAGPTAVSSSTSPTTLKPVINKLSSNKEFMDKLSRHMGSTGRLSSLESSPLSKSVSGSTKQLASSQSAETLHRGAGDSLSDLSTLLRRKFDHLKKSPSSHSIEDGEDAVETASKHSASSAEDSTRSALMRKLGMPGSLSTAVSSSTPSISVAAPSPAKTTPVLRTGTVGRTFSPFGKKPPPAHGSIITRVAKTGPPVAPKPKWYDSIADEAERTLLLESMSKEEKQVQEVSFEIWTTEMDYLKDLEHTQKHYIKPLTELKIKSKELFDLFSNMEQLIPVNQEFLEELQKCKDGVKLQGIGAAFLRVADYFKLYTMYCINHTKAVEAVQKLAKTDAVFKTFLKENYSRPAYNGLNLESYLLKPVQRICKYPLLIKELLKSTPEDHRDRKSLEMAKQKIDGIVSTVNERAKQVETMMKTLDAIQRIKGGKDLHSPSRKFVHEGLLTLRYYNDPTGHSKKYHVFLFSDLLVVTKPPAMLKRREKYSMQQTMEIRNLVLTNFKSPDVVPHSFSLADSTSGECLLITCSSAADKERWIADLDKTGIALDTATDESIIVNLFLPLAASTTTEQQSPARQHSRSLTEPSLTTIDASHQTRAYSSNYSEQANSLFSAPLREIREFDTEFDSPAEESESEDLPLDIATETAPTTSTTTTDRPPLLRAKTLEQEAMDMMSGI